MSHDPIRDRLYLATVSLLTALRPGCSYRVHVGHATNMVDTYQVWLSWTEGPTRYSLASFYNQWSDVKSLAPEGPEGWVERAISEEITEAIRAAAAARREG